MNASGIVIEVTSAETQTLFQMESASAGVRKYSRKCASPMNSPALSCTLFTRIAASGSSRK